MNYMQLVEVFLLVIGLILITIGFFIRIYHFRFRFADLKDGITLEGLAESKVLNPLLKFFSGKVGSKRYELLQRVISKSETEISVNGLYLLKFISLISIAAILLLISYTNMDVKKISIISKPQEDFLTFKEPIVQDYSRNAALYKAVVQRIGEDTLKRLDAEEKIHEIKKILPELMGTGEREIIEEKAASIVKTYGLVSRLRPINLWVILLIILSFWIPEFVLIIKRLLLGNKYRKEVIKLENIFELLGTVRNFKTIDILEEMAKSSKTYRKHLEVSKELFKTEKQQSLEFLKASVKNSRFSRLVDILRVYSMTDKKLALQIMERNRMEKEEELLLTAEEDIDLVDLVAFISIIPIVLQLANLLMKPMLDTIYEAFKFI